MYAIGLDIGGTTIKLGVVRDGEEIVFKDTRPSVHDAVGLAQAAADMLKNAWSQYPDAPAGISCPGAFNEAGLLNANQLDLVEVPFRQLLQLDRDMPIANDGVCALLAELDRGALRGCRTGIMITLGTGIGGGVVADGKPYTGYHGTHAELGHMITHADGKRCSCGQTGCWEAYASASALSQMAEGMEPREILKRVEQGEMADIWQRWLYEVAQGLIGLCSIFFPEVIAIGGGLSNAGETVVGGIRNTLEKDTGFRMYYSHVRVVSTRFRNDAGILGAAALAIREQKEDAQ